MISKIVKSRIILSGIAGISSLLFFLLPAIIFDDSAIILRYMDNFAKGYFFRYNVSDYPVYGISGFIHGLVAGVICYFHLATAEQALGICNFAGFIGMSLFVFLIYRVMTQSIPATLVLWALTITSVNSFLMVASSGLETPLHLCFITGAVYFFLANYKRALYFFCALMIISKLDAVPVALTLLAYEFILNFGSFTGIKTWKESLGIFALFFLFPLLAGLAGIAFLFGTVLPQSAYAKLYYHPHPKESWFPFLQHFLQGPFNKLLFLLCLVFWVISLVDAFWKKKVSVLTYGLFGSLFIASIGLYYIYNPDEQMIWYYAMPELFMIMQVLTGMYFVFSVFGQSLQPYKRVLLLLSIIGFVFYSGRRVIFNFKNLVEASQVVEKERMEIGAYLRNISTPTDTLLSSHGLPSRFFKGYIIDLSGLNSKLATRYRLNADSLIHQFKPHYIVNHAFPEIESIFKEYNYKVLRVDRNITLYGSHSWVVLKRGTPETSFKIKFLNQVLNKGNYVKENEIIKIRSHNGKAYIKDSAINANKTLFVGINKNCEPFPMLLSYFKKDRLLRRKQINIGDFGTPYSKVNNLEFDMSGSDSLVFEMTGMQSFELIEPIFRVIQK